MSYKIYKFIVFRIVIIFTIGMVGTFFSDYLQDSGFFGDSPCTNTYGCGFTDSKISWGARHYWYFWMTSLIFIVSIIMTILGAEEKLNKTENK